ncbi:MULTISPECIES: head completion/stabilization protein [Enterobacteriaceae]|uniref:head completion/stabilization protein n=1 Tax=Enterobacteriaceae TaxID=543 RepID=UPI0004954203|nr:MULTISPECIES: head completion/stabilization protein [Enterobacteriaceae]EJT6938614.1 head completion/stabilization protein [Cronobacter sakazakii]EJT8240055.1 head completion/stabilization protein [Cronobacter sakazakii]EJV9465054.1 head completion/stabilization protein [Cronobacter sakazakii]EJV9504749.1 head completion/stabilization protein [Cronobacter sakazakii]ELY2525606.1 head completion/stabilization protein [Cronobacter sakazakii]
MFSGKPLDYQDEPLTNNGFWPDLNLRDFQAQRALPPDMEADTLAQALITAVMEVNAELVSVEAKHKTQGYAAAADVPGVTMAGINGLCAQYTKAVFARAKADLLGEFATIGRRETHPGQESEETRAGLLAEASVAIRRMKGLKRATVAKV